MKNIFFKCFYILAALIVILNTVFIFRDSLKFDINDLPEGTYTGQTVSPDGKCRVRLYVVQNSLGSGIRASVETDQQKEPRNIYWQTGTDSATVEWIDTQTVRINDVPINVIHNGFYDCRRGMSILLAGSMEGTYRNVPQ